jgi:hypothetical protein
VIPGAQDITRVARCVRGPLVRRSLFATAVAGLTVLAASCGAATKAPSVANISTGGSTTTAAAPAPSQSASPGKSYGNEVAYSTCMRAHGLPDFPDPNSQGHLLVKAHSGGDLNPTSPQYQSANTACGYLLPNDGQNTSAQQQQLLARFLQYAKCMRSHSIPNFPDPTLSDGSVNLILKGTGINLRSPQFQRAQQTCRPLSPRG